jgi:predicted amidohydrolase
MLNPSCVQLVDMGTDTGIAVFEIDLSEVERVRREMPMHLHRRYRAATQFMNVS